MILVLAYLLIPALIVIACQKFSLLDKAGVVVLSFGLGIAIAAGLDLSFFSKPIRLPRCKKMCLKSVLP